MAIDFPVATTVGQTYTDPVSGSTFVVTVVGPPAQWVGSGSSTNLDATYLRKDASNDPVTGTLTVTPSTNVEGLVVTQGATRTAAALRITNEGSGNALIVEDSANPDSSPFVINSTGRVGIGTGSPSYSLDVAAADVTPGTGYAVRIRANATAGAGALQFTDSAATTQYGMLIFGANGVGTLQADGASSALIFSTNSTERARIDSSGDLLIGGTLPSAPNAQITAGGSIVCGGLTAGILNTDSTTIETSSTATVSTGFTLGIFRQALLGVSSAASSSSTFAGGLYIINRENTAGSVGTILGADGLTSVTIDGTTGLISFTPSVSTFRGWRFSYIVVA